MEAQEIAADDHAGPGPGLGPGLGRGPESGPGLGLGLGAGVEPWVDPDGEKLAGELAVAAEELARAEAALAEVKALLRAFGREYGRLFAPLYAEFDEIEARIMERCAERTGRPDDLRDARRARARADESASAADAAVSRPRAPRPTADAKRLYRMLARRCHPDLAEDGADAERRHAFMARVNAAYESGDVDLLTVLADEWEAGEWAASRRGDDDGPDRSARLRRVLEAVRRRLVSVAAERAHVKTTGLGPLLFDEREPGFPAALARLATLAEDLRSRIAERRRVLNRLAGRHA